MIWAAAAVALVIAAALVIRFMRAGVIFEYSETGASVRLKVGPFVKNLDREKNPEKEKTASAESEKRGGGIKDFKARLSIILKALGKLKRRLVVDELTLWYQSACEDPALAALSFGAASAAVGSLLAPMNRALDIRKQDVRTGVSFSEKENRIYAKAVVTAPLFALVSTLMFYLKETKAAANKDTEVS